MDDVKKVLILMSTYNGEEKIIKQVDSILNQINVNVEILIRDDGSDNKTLEILRAVEHKDARVRVQYANNIGWKRSFLDLVYSCPLDYDYFGFSDQDDIWFKDKVYSLISLMESDNDNKVKLGHCNSLSVDKEMRKREEQEQRCPCPSNFKTAIATEFFQGCGMIWNNKAMSLIRQYRPQNSDLSHDYWVGLICYIFGNVYFCEEPKFYHVRYDENSSEDGNVCKGRIKRFKQFLSGKPTYMNPALDLAIGYSKELNEEQRLFINRIIDYKNGKKCKLLMDKDFRRPSLISTILFKLSILINKY